MEHHILLLAFQDTFNWNLVLLYSLLDSIDS